MRLNKKKCPHRSTSRAFLGSNQQRDAKGIVDPKCYLANNFYKGKLRVGFNTICSEVKFMARAHL